MIRDQPTSLTVLPMASEADESKQEMGGIDIIGRDRRVHDSQLGLTSRSQELSLRVQFLPAITPYSTYSCFRYCT